MREFKDCYIAFLDIIGFKDLLKKPKNDLCEYIASLFDKAQEEWQITVQATGTYLTDPTCIKQKIMSDSICFFVEADVPNALAGLIGVCAYLQARLSKQSEPIILRGAIVLGKLYAEGDIVFGQGFVDAYLMEENAAMYPRVILTKALIKQCNCLDKFGNDYIQQFTFDDDDAFVTVDYLYLFYGLSHQKEEWKRFASFVFNRVDEESDASKKGKYLYLRRNIKRAIKKYMDHEERSHA